MSDIDSYIPLQVHFAGFASAICTAVGLPLDPKRLRSWHHLEGLTLGHSDGDARRRYSDQDILGIALMCALANQGFPVGELAAEMAGKSVRKRVHTSDPIGLEGAMAASANGDPEEYVIAAVRRHGQAVRLDLGTREQLFGDDDLINQPFPVTFVNLSCLAAKVRAALIATPQWQAQWNKFYGPES